MVSGKFSCRFRAASLSYQKLVVNEVVKAVVQTAVKEMSLKRGGRIRRDELV